MEEPNGEAYEQSSADPAAADPDSAVLPSSERDDKAQTERTQYETDVTEDEVTEAVRRFWNFVKKTFREADTGERLTAWLTLILIGVGSVTVTVYYKQLEQMRASTQAAGDAAAAAKSAADTAKKAMELDQRAWVGITYPGFNVDQEGDRLNFVVPIEISNPGKTPARRVRIRARCIIIHGPYGPIQLDPLVSKHYALLRFELIQPGQKIPISGIPALDEGPDGKTVPVITTPELRSRIKAAKYTVTVTGRITYEDFEGREHWLTFCHQSNGLLGGSAQCFDFNDFDKDEAEQKRK